MPAQDASVEEKVAYQLADQLKAAATPHAFVGPMAVKLHGARSFSEDVVVLLNRHGLDHFRQDYVGASYDQVSGRPRRFVDRNTGVKLEVKVSGHYPGRTSPGPFPYPDPVETCEELKGVSVVPLDQLVQLNLAEGRYQDLADVVFLVSAHGLDEGFLEKLHPSVHHLFAECLEEKRRQDEFEAWEG